MASSDLYSLLPIRYSLGQSIRPADHGIAVGCDDAPPDQVLQMRQHGIAGSRHQPRIDSDIDGAHHARDVGLTLGQAMQDRGLARLAVADQEAHIARAFRNFGTMAREIAILLARREALE